MKYLSYLLMFIGFTVYAQNPKVQKDSAVYDGLKFRNIGPAFSSGRIADIAIHPEDDNTWYVAVGSGGVWKTENAGVTWTPVFDKQNSYSIGCVTIDENNPDRIWVGTGENVGGRHVGFGDGIYRSDDGGKSWTNMGLKSSEHISRIVVDPNNSDIIFVAAQGPLWAKGGERGLYKSTDGGTSWEKVLGDDEWTGVTDIVMDPEDPERLFAATWQRHRNVAVYMGGGPGSGIHRSTDGGKTWKKLTSGIPGSNLGKIGLAISPFDTDIIYAAIELDRRTGGLFISQDGGNSWSKQSDAVSGGTGPHYYQELYASPHHEGTIYLADVRMQISNDHGKTFRTMKESRKHSDNHSLTFRKDDPDYLLVGTDGGIYESFDLAENWRFIANLPVTQYYKLAVDDAIPFYNVFGGTQDNGTHAGPSRTLNAEGIRNADWAHILGADGHQTATEPGNPSIVYGEGQQGWLHRIDRITGEQVYIQPQPGKGDPHERQNWDAPILVSAHDHARIYTASYRVWRSDNRGDSWTPVSGDLTKNQERIELPVMGRKQSWDNPWDIYAMSTYNTISSLGESPVQEGILYVGTDDGLIQVTEDGGENWRRIEVGSIKGIPGTAFVNDIRADLYDAKTVYAALDNHKFGDFSPYLIKSTDAGKNWTSIVGNIPGNTLVWRLVQDEERKDLLFLATEQGVYFTLDGGDKWTRLDGGMPTISVRDITIQRRENDLVAASFGRGFFILDDISPLREVSRDLLEKEAHIFPVKDALKFYRKNQTVDPGMSDYRAKNPPYGAVFTYYLKEDIQSLEDQRKEIEKKLEKSNSDIPFPGWLALENEKNEEKPFLLFTIYNANGNVVNHVEAPAKKGIHRVNWNLRYASKFPQNIIASEDVNIGTSGFDVPPGQYSVALFAVQESKVKPLAEKVDFEVRDLYTETALAPVAPDVVADFREDMEEGLFIMGTMVVQLDEAKKDLVRLKNACYSLDEDATTLIEKIYSAEKMLHSFEDKFSGLEVKNEVGEKQALTVQERMMNAYRGLSTTYGPTLTHRESLRIAEEEMSAMKADLDQLVKVIIPGLISELREAGAPYPELR